MIWVILCKDKPNSLNERIKITKLSSKFKKRIIRIVLGAISEYDAKLTM